MCSAQLSYGIPADLADDLFDVSETTANLCLGHFCGALTESLASVYLRNLTAHDLQRVEQEFAAAGFPGCIGCLDGAAWARTNCPKALQDVMTGKDAEATVRMLWVWSFQFNLAGAINDLNILEASSHFSRVSGGSFPPVSTSYNISGKPILLVLLPHRWNLSTVENFYPVAF